MAFGRGKKDKNGPAADVDDIADEVAERTSGGDPADDGAAPDVAQVRDRRPLDDEEAGGDGAMPRLDLGCLRVPVLPGTEVRVEMNEAQQPIAATVVLIRLIEAFKIIDIPNVLTAGGPGLATESMTLHSFIAWRTQDLGGSAAIGYLLLFVSTITCVSFFNYVVRPTRRYQ